MKTSLPRILFLYPNEWDRLEIARAGLHQHFEIVFEGFDRYSIRKRLQLALFDPIRFVDQMVVQYRGKVQGVASNDDHWGALLAALIARELRLPRLEPEVLVTCQHKALFRQREQETSPEQAPWFDVIEPATATHKIPKLPYPIFIKPVKSSFSVLARPIASAQEMQMTTEFSWYEKLSQYVALRSVAILHRHVIGVSQRLPDIRSFIAETPMTGCQVNIDGFVENGVVTILGVIDTVMYPETHAFKRFEYPSQLPPQALAALHNASKALLENLNYQHGFFNIEAFVKPMNTAGAYGVQIIEVNPRMARQLTSIYQAVEGFDCWHALFSLACGLAVKPATCPTMNNAASFVRRSFDGRLPSAPSAQQMTQVRTKFPDARLHLYLRPRGFGKARELKWVGSYRYAVTNLAAKSRTDLFSRYEEMLETLGWESEYREPETNPCEALGLHYHAQTTAK